MYALQAIRTPSIRESVSEAIRSALREGQLCTGEDLNEANLATHFQVSRGPIREALFVLAEEGVLNYFNNKGFSVPKFTERDRAQINELRLMMESRALELARDSTTPAHVRRLEELQQEMISLFLDNRVAARDGVELAFHGMIWELSGNPWLVRCLRRAMVPYFTFSRTFHLRWPDLTIELFSAQHQLFIDYLRGATGKTAEECVRFHLEP